MLTGLAVMLGRRPAAAGGTLDTQTVTVAQSGSTPNRIRGFDTSPILGSISDGTSNVFAGAAITEMFFDETAGEFTMTITGASNSGWTSITNTTDGNVLTRASAVFTSGSWVWSGGSLSSFFTGTGAKTIGFD